MLDSPLVPSHLLMCSLSGPKLALGAESSFSSAGQRLGVRVSEVSLPYSLLVTTYANNFISPAFHGFTS